MKTSENLFKSNLTGKALKSAKAESKKAVSEALRNYEAAINGAFNAVIKSSDKRSRDVANAAKGQYKTAVDVVANCYPYQAADGTLMTKKADADGIKRWQPKKLTAAAARGIVRDALNCFINGVGTPVVLTVVEGDECPSKK